MLSIHCRFQPHNPSDICWGKAAGVSKEAGSVPKPSQKENMFLEVSRCFSAFIPFKKKLSEVCERVVSKRVVLADVP